MDQQKQRVIDFYQRIERDPLARPKRGFMGWLERRDLRALEALLDAAPGQSLLDVGAGLGVQARMFQRAGLRVTAVENVPARVELLGPHVGEALLGDVDHLDLGRRFDRVICIGVLDYTADRARAVHNLARHVAPGGRLVIEVPRRSLGGLVYRAAYRLLHHIDVNLFTIAELDEVAKLSGLRPARHSRPFLHSLFGAWTGPVADSAAEPARHVA